jgi:hypothetical protein
VLVTSLTPNPARLDRQREALQTWHNIGARIVVQNAPDELPDLQAQFPLVHEWVEGNQGAQRVLGLLQTAAAQDGVVVNSDVEVRGSKQAFQSAVRMGADELLLGLRWNYTEDHARAREFQWGIDIVGVPAAWVDRLPGDLPYTIGQPMWDYAVPALLQRAGITPKLPHSRVFYHREHAQAWTPEAHAQGLRWLRDRLGEPQWDAGKFRRSLDPHQVYDEQHGIYRYNHWQPLHLYPVQNVATWDPDRAKLWFYKTWTPGIPASCGCQESWAKLPTPVEADFASPMAFFEWGFYRHDHVSRHHANRPVMTLEEALDIYWPNELRLGRFRRGGCLLPHN